MRNPVFRAAGLTVFERGWLSANNVLFDGSSNCESVLVDTGYCTHAEQTLALVREALAAKPLDRIVNTHLHSDHCGGNRILQDMFVCGIDVPDGEAVKVDRWDERALTFRDTGQQCPQFRRTGTLRDGDGVSLGTGLWRVIAAPGHDPESIALYHPDLQVLISADALWENGFGVVFPELESVGAFDDVRNTLHQFARLSVRWVIPGHGAPFQDFEGALTRAHRRLDGFVSDPQRHSRYAAKVLMKFHLLEVQREPWQEFTRWLETTRFMRLSHGRYFAATDFRAWYSELVEELVASGAVRRDSISIANV